MKSIIGLIKKYTVGQRCLYMVCMGLGMLSQILLLIQPQFGGELISSVQSGSPALEIVAILCALLLSNAVLVMLQQALIGKISETVVKNTRLRLSKIFFSLPVLEQESKAPGWYSQRITNDVELVKSITGQVIAFVQSSIMLVGSTIALAVIAPSTFVIGLTLGFTSFFFTIFASRPIKSLVERVQECSMSMTINIQESALAGRLLRAYNAWDNARKKFEKGISDSYDAGFRMSLLSSCLSPVASALMQLANIGTILFGAYQVADGTLQFSELVMFLMYFSSFSSSVSQIAGVFVQVREAEAGDKRISELEALGTQVKKNENGLDPNIVILNSPDITFDHVSFRYTDEGGYALSDVTFKVPKKRTTAIVGSSGGGKTTCLGMIEGFYAPDSGRVLVDNNDLQAMNIADFRKVAGFIDQGSIALTGTVRSNLQLKDRVIPDKVMSEALEAVGLRLSHSTLDYDVGENGAALSGGQRQRLALARAILENPKILIMDEPTASLDGIAENEINHLLRDNFPEATIVYTAHRLSLILSADWIVVINEGRVVGQGIHHDLVNQSTYYKQLVESQNH